MNFLAKLKSLDSAKIYSILGQVTTLGMGYLTQVFLYIILTSRETFSHFQLSNFTTNLFGLIVGSIIPTLFSAYIINVPEEKRKSELEKIFLPYVATLLIQSAIMFVLFIALNIGGQIDSFRLEIFILSTVQVFAFSLMNLFHMYFIGTRNLKKFFTYYFLYGILKSAFTLTAAFIFNSAESIITAIALAATLQTVIIMVTTKFKFRKPDMPTLTQFKTRFLDQFIANLVMFGLMNFSFIAAYFKIKQDYGNFNLLALTQPIGLVPYYLVSSLGNIYLVDFSRGHKTAADIRSILIKMLGLLVAFCIASLIAATVVFYLFNRESLVILLQYVLIIFPSTIAIAILSVLLSIYQGLGKLHKLRWVVILLIPIYVIISYLDFKVEQIILISGVAYLFIALAVGLFSRQILWEESKQ